MSCFAARANPSIPSRSAPTAATMAPYAGSAHASSSACRFVPEPETSTTRRAARRAVTRARLPAPPRSTERRPREWRPPCTLPFVLFRHANSGAHMGYPPQYPPQGYPPQGQPQPIDNNMTMSIVAIFLFWPLAIPAIINASKVNPALQVGDYAGAQNAAN